MMNLLIYELRRIVKSGLAWCLLAVMAALMLFVQMQWPGQNILREELSAQARIIPVYPLLSDDLTAAPAFAEEMEETAALLEKARQENQINGSIWQAISGDRTFSAYTLFRLTQTGFLMLGSFVLALAGSDFFMGPSLRRAGSMRMILAKVLSLSLAAAVIFLLPKAAVLLFTSGSDALDLVLPFNPRAGVPLFLSEDSPGIQGYTGWRSIEASALMTLRQAFLYLFAYEGVQILVWVSFGLLCGILLRRRYFALALVSFLVLAQKSADFSYGPLADFLFLSYDDALRDVLGSALMARGITQSIVPQDYLMGLSVMFITFLACLWFSDLACRRRFFQISRKGDDDAQN